MNRRHFQEEEFPEHCDHCPREFSPGAQYQRVQMIVDATASTVSEPQAASRKQQASGSGSESGRKPNAERREQCLVEHSFELVFCLDCAGRLNHWLQHPLSAVAADGEVLDELDDGELQDELEKELYILAEGPEGPEAAGCRLQVSEEEKNPGPNSTSLQPAACSPLYLHPRDCHCPECAPCRHHPGVDCGCLCRFGTCGPATCPSAPEPQPAARSPQPCLDPDQMHGAADQFPGSDYYGDEPFPWSRP